MSKRPTLKTISDLTGLAVPTVSRALSDAPDIGESTKALVKKTAHELGYSPNRAGLRLRTGRTNVISLVLAPEESVVNQTANMIRAISEGLRETNFHLNMTPYLAGDDLLKPIRYIVETGAADAIIFNQTQPEDARVDYLLKRNFPFVTHGRTKWQDAHAYYDFDNRLFAQKAIEALVHRGRKRILFITPIRSQRYAIAMLEGAGQAAQALGVTLDAPLALNSDMPLDAIRDGVESYLKAHPETDAIATGTVNSAMASWSALTKLGQRAGADIDLAAKEPGPFLENFDDNFIVFHEDIRRAGRFLAKAAIHAIDHPDDPPMQELERP